MGVGTLTYIGSKSRHKSAEKGQTVLIEGVVAEAFATNCYVVAAKAGSECVIVDPGIGIEPQLDALIAKHQLRPVAVMLTHGHLDHTFSVTPVCGARDVPAYIHAGDAELLKDPMKGLSSDMNRMFAGRFSWTEPDDVVAMTDGTTLEIAGLTFTLDHAPGHTPGSTLFNLPGDDHAEGYCLTGDVLFKGTIGRTDLPGGNTDTMMSSLREKILPKHDDIVVYPGHGQSTTIGSERLSNPFLRGLSEHGHIQAPTRGL